MNADIDESNFKSTRTGSQDQMLRAFEHGRTGTNDYNSLLANIFVEEKRHAIKPRASRILCQENTWKDYGLGLLPQLDPALLRSILRNKLAYRLTHELEGALEKVDGPTDAIDAAVYVNCLAGEDGRGIEVTKFELFLDVIEVAASPAANNNNTGQPAALDGSNDSYSQGTTPSDSTDSGQDLPMTDELVASSSSINNTQGHPTSDDIIDQSSSINDYSQDLPMSDDVVDHSSSDNNTQEHAPSDDSDEDDADDDNSTITATSTDTNTSLSDPLYLQRDRVQARIDRMFKSARNGRPEGFFARLTESDRDSLHDSAMQFVQYHRTETLPDAQGIPGLTHITLNPEVGVSSCVRKRCNQHARLSNGSPALFRLVQLVAMSMFPERAFSLHQYILFRFIDANEAAIAETIGSIICGSYLTLGGVNTSQPGLSLGTLTQFDARDWDAVQTSYFTSARHQMALTNLNAYRETARAANRSAKEELAALDRRIEFKQLTEKKERLEALLAAEAAALGARLEAHRVRKAALDREIEAFQHDRLAPLFHRLLTELNTLIESGDFLPQHQRFAEDLRAEILDIKEEYYRPPTPTQDQQHAGPSNQAAVADPIKQESPDHESPFRGDEGE